MLLGAIFSDFLIALTSFPYLDTLGPPPFFPQFHSSIHFTRLERKRVLKKQTNKQTLDYMRRGRPCEVFIRSRLRIVVLFTYNLEGWWMDDKDNKIIKSRKGR